MLTFINLCDPHAKGVYNTPLREPLRMMWVTWFFRKRITLKLKYFFVREHIKPASERFYLAEFVYCHSGKVRFLFGLLPALFQSEVLFDNVGSVREGVGDSGDASSGVAETFHE